MFLVSITFILSIAASIIGTFLYMKWTLKKKNRPLHQILNFGHDELLFVFAHRDEGGSILPRTSTEDFLAMNNFISALLNIGWKGKISVRDTKRLTDSDRKKNIVSICSSKSNKFTKEVESKLLKKGVDFYYSKKDSKSEHWYITDGNAIFPSRTYDQIDDFLSKGRDRRDVPEQKLDDVALITKITNPWNATNKIVIIAGVRGVGTWGAAECIKKEWKQIHSLLKHFKKGCDFSAILSINYNNCDILNIKVLEVKRILS